MSGDGHSLLLAFEDESREFALGFEIGRVWAILQASDDSFECEMHVAGAEMILRLAEATERTVRVDEMTDVWCTAYFSERAAS